MFNDAIKTPSKYEVTITNIGCINGGGSSSGPKCSNEEEHLFWDAAHPTTVIQKHIAFSYVRLLINNFNYPDKIDLSKYVSPLSPYDKLTDCSPALFDKNKTH